MSLGARSWGVVPDDAELVRRLKGGQLRAFEDVYEAHRRRIFSVLLRLSGRRDVAEDLMQETFIKLARAAPRLADDTRLGAWLVTVARNTYVSHRRWAMLDLSRVLAFGAEAATVSPRTPHDETDAGRSIARLEKALLQISDAHREVLVLVAIEELDQDEIASMLGITPIALRKRVSRARSELAERLTKNERSTLKTIPRGAP